MVKTAILIFCIVEVLLSIAWVSTLIHWDRTLDVLYTQGEYLTSEEREKTVKKEKALSGILTWVSIVIMFCILAIVILAFLA